MRDFKETDPEFADGVEDLRKALGISDGRDKVICGPAGSAGKSQAELDMEEAKMLIEGGSDPFGLDAWRDRMRGIGRSQ